MTTPEAVRAAQEIQENFVDGDCRPLISKTEISEIAEIIAREYAPRVAERDRLQKQLVGDVVCQVCCGHPLSGGTACICNGTGLHSEEVIGLRKEVFRLAEKNKELVEALTSARRNFLDLRHAADLADCIGSAVTDIDLTLFEHGDKT